MKVVCAGCQAKYQIPDERVAGRKLKIRCRKCGEAIIVRGDQAAQPALAQMGYPPPPTADEWHVSLEGDQHGPYPSAQMATMLRNGQLAWARNRFRPPGREPRAGAGWTPTTRGAEHAYQHRSPSSRPPHAPPPAGGRQPCPSAPRARHGEATSPPPRPARSSRARMRATVVVFPVPGPPATTAKRHVTTAAEAWRWRSGTEPGKSRSSPDANSAA